MAEDEPEKKEGKVKGKMDAFVDKMKKEMKSDKITKPAQYVWGHWIEFVTGALMLIGIILAFFFYHIGGVLVGLAVGICFYEEIQSYFIQLRDYYTTQGLFKTLMFIGTALYLLIVAPAFLIALVIGFGLMSLINWGIKRQG